ncbi:MAG: ureidoglycolate lyase [Bdellovibrionales bacterium]|nr:ureidoglycolate lyase [Bdellovibrionales bacterium]
MDLSSEPLTRDAYRPYGAVVAADAALPSKSANNGTAERYNHLGELKNLRETTASPNLCVFRSRPYPGSPFRIRLLERHPHSTQLFVPMSESARYLVIVATGEDSPDRSTVRAFIARSGQGITYHPGVWHHPLIALDRTTDFACVVYEDGSAGDCEARPIDPPIDVLF